MRRRERAIQFGGRGANVPELKPSARASQWGNYKFIGIFETELLGWGWRPGVLLFKLDVGVQRHVGRYAQKNEGIF